jgi:hypothetical protein
MSTEHDALAARAVAIDLLSPLHTFVGDVNQIARIVELMSLVISTADITQRHFVTNERKRAVCPVIRRTRCARAQRLWRVPAASERVH